MVGEVYAIEPQLERRLDEIEEIYPQPTGEYFKRLLITQVDGRSFECLVYEIDPERVAGKALIGSGDWLNRR